MLFVRPNEFIIFPLERSHWQEWLLCFYCGNIYKNILTVLIQTDILPWCLCLLIYELKWAVNQGRLHYGEIDSFAIFNRYKLRISSLIYIFVRPLFAFSTVMKDCWIIVSVCFIRPWSDWVILDIWMVRNIPVIYCLVTQFKVPGV